MRLLWSSRSPFARKVMVAAHELGIADRIALERVAVATDKTDPGVMELNPLNQIPTLIRDDGSVLFDSTVILDYLNASFGGDLIPSAGEARWRVLGLQALGDGLAQVNRGRLAEGRRGEDAAPDYLKAFATKTRATLDRLEQEASAFDPISVGSIAVAVALAHLDFRFPDEGWRAGRPRLAAWFGAFDERSSMRATAPEEVY